MKQKDDLTIEFVEKLVDRILEGKYKIGESIPSLRQLAEEFGCSRSVINVGIARLESQGYLTIQKRQKTIVNDFVSKGSLNVIKDMALSRNQYYREKASVDILNARKLIELEAIKCAARVAQKSDISRLERIIAEETALINAGVKDYNTIARKDFELHYQIIKMSNNIVYLSVMNSFKEMAHEMTKVFYKKRVDLFPYYVEKHKEILFAIRLNDELKAKGLLKEILEHGEDAYIKLEN